MQSESSINVEHCVKIRGLPWSCKPADVLTFFDDVRVDGGEEGVHLCLGRDGRLNGEGYVILESEEDVDRAIKHDRQNMGKRYIEIFRGDPREASWYIKRRDLEESSGEGVVKLRGLPFGVTKEEIAHFFSGMEIVPNGIYILTDNLGRATGDAFVQFASEDLAERAREERNRERIGHRYIEIFKSSMMDARAALAAQFQDSFMRQYDQGAGGFPPFPVAGGWPTPFGYPMPGTDWSPDWHDRNDSSRHDRNRDRNRDRDRDRPSFSASAWRQHAAPYPPMWMQPRFDSYTGTSRSSTDRHSRSAAENSHSRTKDSTRSRANRDWAQPQSEWQSSGGHSVRLRGLPFDCTEQQIYEFFAPLRPTFVQMRRMKNGKAAGDADVGFASHEEAMRALSKDRQCIGRRYIEIFMGDESGHDSTAPAFGQPPFGMPY